MAEGTSPLERAVMELEAKKDAAFLAEDFDECERLRAEQMQLLGNPGSAPANPFASGDALASEVQGVETDLADLASLRRELENDLVASNIARADTLDMRRSVGLDSGPKDAAVSRAETMRAVAELEELKLRLMDGRSLEDCGVIDDGVAEPIKLGRNNAWGEGDDATAQNQTQDQIEVSSTAESMGAMMAEMAQLNAEMDAELAALRNKVDTARAQRSELQAGHLQLKQQVEEAEAVVQQEEQRLKY